MLDTEKIIRKYYEPGSQLYHILVEHSLRVRDKALAIAARKPELQLDTEFIAEAAMLHDIGIFMCYAPGIACNGTHKYIEHGYLGADLLRKEGLPRHALVCERHTGVGLTLKTIVENKLPLPRRDMLPLSGEEKLICYADKFFSKSKLNEEHRVEAIRNELAKYGEYQLEVFDSWHSLYTE
ncbi:MAG: hypothetical protein H6Q20_2100 [Bacteroidetes bacterium]|jgi:uncharacterized protein|nr:hypothetical protein [Bacteroidota bacterium]